MKEKLQCIKERLKDIKILYAFVSYLKARKFERHIEKENNYYSKIAKRKNIRYDESLCKELLSKRLQGKVKPKEKGKLRIFAAFHHLDWEIYGLLPGLEKFGEVIHYDWNPPFNQWHKDWYPKIRQEMNSVLLEKLKQAEKNEHVDVFFGYLSGWHISRKTITEISKLGIPTVNLGMDEAGFRGRKLNNDEYYSHASLANVFDLNWVFGNKMHCVKYLVEGGIPLYLAGGANPEIHKPLDLPRDIDVSFVGRKFGKRPLIVDRLAKKGIKVQTFGYGWETGPIDLQKMVEVYNRSKINLGFGGLGHSSKIQDLKGRDFEVPMSGGLYLTQYNSELEDYYEIGKEIVCYRNTEELAEKIRYLLDHPEEAEEIRQAGYKRALEDHTWEKRFEKIFRMVGVLLN